MVKEFVRQAWADFFGLTPVDLARAGTRVAADAPGLSWFRGLYLLQLDDACIISAPAELAPQVIDRAADAGPDVLFQVDAARALAGDAAGRAYGPSWHGYLDADAFIAAPPCDARPLTADDEVLVDSLRGAVDPAEWTEGGFDPYPDVVWGAFEHGQIVALGNMTDFAGQPADVGLLVLTSARRRGLGTQLAGAMTADALKTIPVIRYRALFTNTASLGVAEKLGFVGYGANIAVRLL